MLNGHIRLSLNGSSDDTFSHSTSMLQAFCCAIHIVVCVGEKEGDLEGQLFEELNPISG